MQKTEMTENRGLFGGGVENNFPQMFRIVSEAHTVSYGSNVKGAEADSFSQSRAES
jgi:hypothetical protein